MGSAASVVAHYRIVAHTERVCSSMSGHSTRPPPVLHFLRAALASVVACHMGLLDPDSSCDLTHFALVMCLSNEQFRQTRWVSALFL